MSFWTPLALVLVGVGLCTSASLMKVYLGLGALGFAALLEIAVVVLSWNGKSLTMGKHEKDKKKDVPAPSQSGSGASSDPKKCIHLGYSTKWNEGKQGWMANCQHCRSGWYIPGPK